MEFKKYRSIESILHERTTAEYIKIIQEKNIPCVVTEKVDGANFAIYVDRKGNIQAASRKKFLAPKDNFFGYQDVIERYTPNIIENANFYLSKYQNAKYIIFYGELFGGWDPNKKAKGGIQKRIFYSPTVEWILFDIRIVEPDKDFFLPWLSVKDAGREIISDSIEKATLPLVPVLYDGNIEACIKFGKLYTKSNGPTKIPKIYGYNPEIEDLAEGVVIKPAEDLYDEEGHRIAIKIKHPKFEEIRHTKDINPENHLNELEQLVARKLTAYITENRLKSVLTKTGVTPDFKNFKQIVMDLRDDAWEDAEKDGIFEGTIKRERKKINTYIVRYEIRPLVRNYIKKKL